MENYTPSKTCLEFMRDTSKVRAIIGPLGSGKSTAAIMELFRRAVEQEPDARGIRPTRFACIRNTLSQLRMTTIADTLAMFPFARYKVSTQTIEFRLNLADGTRVESDWHMMPLERPEDQRKLLSLQLTSAFIEECREIQYSVLPPLRGRLGRYPSKSRVKPTWTGLLLVSNPWSVSSEWHDHLVLNRPDNWGFHHQPGAFEPNAENVENLPENYYEDLMNGASQEFINVHVHAMFGEDQFGQAVFQQSFNSRNHVVAQRLKVNPELPVLIGMDFGRTPCAIFGQEDVWGRLVILEELTSEDMNLNAFCQQLLIPRIKATYHRNRVFIVGDPAGAVRSQFSEETAFSVLKSYGLDAIPAPTNDPDQRIRAVEKRLLTNLGDKTGFVMSAPGCPQLTNAMARNYRYKKKRDGELEAKPEKNSASHVADALQYLCLGMQSNYVGRKIAQRTMPLARNRTRFSSRAWT